MLNITGMNRFYYLRNFHDMRCKYGRVLSIIHQQMNREPEAGDVYIMMSRDRRLVRLYSYDSRSCSLYEKKFMKGYKFMNVEKDGERHVFSINWRDVVVLLESPSVKVLKVR